jgi:hypothetical protein
VGFDTATAELCECCFDFFTRKNCHGDLLGIWN